MATTYRLGEVANLLGISTDAVRKLVDTGELTATRTSGGHRLIDGADLSRFLREQHESADPLHDSGLSARNQFRGIVTKVVKDTVVAQVEIVSGPHRLVSIMTREAVDELGLEPGVLAVAAVKAPAVFVELGTPTPDVRSAP